MKYLKIALFAILFLPFIVKGQYRQFTQNMASPTFTNPAFAGFQQNLSGGLQYRNQWNGYLTSWVASADLGLPKINSGIGFTLLTDNMYVGLPLGTNAFIANYSYEFKLGEKSFLRLGISASVISQIETEVLAINPPRAFFYPIVNPLNLGSGLLFYNNNFYIGASASNIIKSNGTDLERDMGYATDPIINFQTGDFIKIGAIKLNPNLAALHQGDYTMFLPGINISYNMFTIGTSYRYAFQNVNSINFLLGFSKGIFKLYYSYDHSLSGTAFPDYNLRGISAGSHEISLIFQLNKPNDTTNKPMIDHLRNAF